MGDIVYVVICNEKEIAMFNHWRNALAFVHELRKDGNSAKIASMTFQEYLDFDVVSFNSIENEKQKKKENLMHIRRFLY